MSLFKKGGVFADVIRCDEPDYLIWKWHALGSTGSENSRENSIRWGSSLRVKDGSVAVFVYKQKNGVFQDFIEGPFDEILSTKNLPILTDIIGLAYNGESPFQAEVYFINLAKIIQSKFVVPYFDVYDPRFQDFAVPVAVRGTISYQINDYREFIKLHRLDSFDRNSFDRQVNDAVIKYVKSAVTNAPRKNDMSVLQLEQNIEQINDIIGNNIKGRFASDFGVLVSETDLAAIDVDKSSEGYIQLKSITQDVTIATHKAKAETEVKTIHDKQRIEMEDYEETLRIRREEGAYAQHKQTQSTNISAFQIEKQAEVGVAGAEALGQMGANGAGSVNLGGESGGTGFNPAAMMTGIAMGSVVANNIAGTMQNAMGGMSQITPSMVTPSSTTAPEIVFNVLIDGKTTGPYNIETLSVMAQACNINAKTLVWRPGMSAWARLEEVDELKIVLSSIPPLPPTT